MNKSKIIGLVMLAGAATVGFASVAHVPKRVENNMMLVQRSNNNSNNSNGMFNYTEHSVDGTVTVTCDGLWINEEPFVNDGNMIIVPKGVELHAIAESSNGWYKVSYEGKTGWIGGEPYSTFKSASPKNFTIVKNYENGNYVATTTTTADLCMNEKPFPNDGIITILPKGTNVRVLEESSNGWYYVMNNNGKKGWIGGPYTTGVKELKRVLLPVGGETSEQFLGEVEVTAEGLCMNKSPEPNDGVIKVLHKGTVVKLLGTSSNGWYQVWDNGQQGWIGGAPYSKIIKNYDIGKQHQGALNPNAEEIATVKSPVGLWLLGASSIEGKKIEIMPYNAKLIVLGQVANWTEVSYNGQVGWCYSQYLNNQ